MRYSWSDQESLPSRTFHSQLPIWATCCPSAKRDSLDRSAPSISYRRATSQVNVPEMTTKPTRNPNPPLANGGGNDAYAMAPMTTARKPVFRPPTRLLRIAAPKLKRNGVCSKTRQKAWVSSSAHIWLPAAIPSRKSQDFCGTVTGKAVISAQWISARFTSEIAGSITVYLSALPHRYVTLCHARDDSLLFRYPGRLKFSVQGQRTTRSSVFWRASLAASRTV